MGEKVGWLRKIRKLKIRDRYRLSHPAKGGVRKTLVGGFSLPLKHFHTLAYESKKRVRMSVKRIRPRLRKVALSALALILVLAMVFGLSVVRGPVPTAGLPAVALAEAGQSLSLLTF